MNKRVKIPCASWKSILEILHNFEKSPLPQPQEFTTLAPGRGGLLRLQAGHCRLDDLQKRIDPLFRPPEEDGALKSVIRRCCCCHAGQALWEKGRRSAKNNVTCFRPRRQRSLTSKCDCDFTFVVPQCLF
jgi:hypothetical protein